MRIAFEIEIQWGKGQLDLGKLKDLATGGKCTNIEGARA